MRLQDLRVGVVEYAMNGSTIAGRWSDPEGMDRTFTVGEAPALVPKIDLLRDELRDPAAVSAGAVGQLRRFMTGWGRSFLPAELADARLDVLVVVPHALLHDLPLHLVTDSDDAGARPLGARVGIAYASSPTLFARCAARNPIRRQPNEEWVFGAVGADEEVAPVNAPRPRSLWAVAADVLHGEDALFWDICGRLGALVTAAGGTAHVDHRFGSRMGLKAAYRQKEPVDVLCVMAHGFVDSESHRLSGLFMGREGFGGVSARSIGLHGGRYFDFRDLPLRRPPLNLPTASPTEILTIAELEIDIDAQAAIPLVVLLACSAGWGRVLQGDEPASLAETFLHVGASSVVAASWDSDVDATRAWMEAFFHAWIDRGLPKALAARHATARLAEGAWAGRPELYGVITLRGDWL